MAENRPGPPRPGIPSSAWRLGAALLVTLGLAAPARATLGYRKPLTVQAGQVVAGPLANFPMLVSIVGDGNLRTVGNGGRITSPLGHDIQFRAADGSTVLDHEIESYDAVAGTLVAWVRVPSLANGTQIFLYYGDPFVTCSLANPGSVWDANYRAVYHLAQSFLDSTTQHQDSVNGGTTDVAAQIGRGRAVLLTPPAIIQTDYTEALTQATLSAWVRWNGTRSTADGGTATLFPRIIEKSLGLAAEKRLLINNQLATGPLGAIRYDSADGTWRTAFTLPAAPAAPAWAHITVVDDATTAAPTIYVNGASVAFATSTARTAPQPNTVAYSFGNQPALLRSLDGQIDEIRISSTLRSAGWISTEFNNQSAPAAFYSVGAEQTPAPTSAGGCAAVGQGGKDGAFTAPAGSTVANKYAVLGSDAARGATSITVAYPGGADGLTAAQLSAGDLLLVVQMQGANMDTSNTASYGQITRLNSSGLHELVTVASVSGGTINLACAKGLRNSYTASGRVQVVKVPQYTSLTVGAGRSIVAPVWNATSQFYGGLVAIRAESVSLAGSIDVTGRGFRGGRDVAVGAAAGFGSAVYRTATVDDGAEKGEGIAGTQAGYDVLNGRYGRGAPANGGGGGNGHNSSGGGGANGHNGLVWNGQGNPDTSGAGWAAAWNLDPSLTSTTTSSGGGRGGYSFSLSNQNAQATAPGNAAWAGDNRREAGGLGGRPLPGDAGSRVFMGGGAGAGHTNFDATADGGDGGGVVFLLARSIGGGGSILANGTGGSCTTDQDGCGGGGAGGSIVVQAMASVANLALQANGGTGGSQPVTGNPLEAEGPGGGGGGGFIALSSITVTSVTQNANAGANGTTASAALTEFLPNGATRGAAGTTGGSATTIPGGCLSATSVGTGCPAGTIPSGVNRITNGDFSAGTAGWTSGVVVAPTDTKPFDTQVAVQNGAKCYDGGGGTTCPAAVIQAPFPGDPLQVVASANAWVYANGNSTGAPYRVWEQTVAGLTVGTTYNFFAYASNASAPGQFFTEVPALVFHKDGAPVSPGLGVAYDTAASGDVWQRYQATFTATAASATLAIFDAAAGVLGDDVALTRLGVQACAPPTAVTLLAFTGQGRDAAVDLDWETASELDNLGFHLYRSTTAEGPYERITPLIPGLGSSPSGRRYTHRDAGLLNGVTYFYRLEDVDTSGASTSHGPVTATPQPADSEDDGHGSGGSGLPGFEAHGEPGATSLHVVERGESYVVLELRTGGFFARDTGEGTVELEVPTFEEHSRPGLPAVPTRRAFVEALAGRRVKLTSATASETMAFPGMRPVEAGTPEAQESSSGALTAGRGPARSGADGLRGAFPARSARLVGSSFQGETKKAEVELAPLRWNASTGQLLLARRLVVRLDFAGPEPGEVSLGGSRGRRPIGEIRPAKAPEVQLVVSAKGLQQVRYEEAYPGGRVALPLASLRLARRGVAVPFHADGPAFRPGSSLFFLSDGPALNPDGTRAVYELSRAKGGIPMPTADAAPAGSGVSYALRTATWEQNKTYQAGLLEAPDLWLWEALVAPVSRSYTFTVDRLASVSTPGRLAVHLQGASDLEVAPDHHVRLSVNGAFVGEASWDGKLARAIEADLTPGLLLEGANTLQVENVGDAAAQSFVLLDRFAVTYPRLLEAESGAFEGRFTEAGRAEVAGFPPGSLLLDVTDATPKWLTGASTGPSGLAFRAETGRAYAAFSPSATSRPEVRRSRQAYLRKATQRADWVLVAPREFLSQARPLVSLRSRQGLRALAVALEDVQDEFGNGEAGPHGLRAFLSFAYHSWKRPAPQYVVLLGDASYDPKDYTTTGTKDRVPTPVVGTTYLRTASDPAYAMVNGDDLLPDLAIGRLPAKNAEEARVLVEKVLAFEAAGNDLRGPAVLVADDADAGGPFEANADEIAALVAGREVEKVYLRDTSDARGDIRAALDRGASLLSYVGHGSIAVWASENVWNNTDVAGLGPQPRQPVLLTLDCLNGFFHFPPLDSLSEAMVKAEGKAAIAAFSPSGLSLDAPAHVFHKALVAELVPGRHLRLGDAVLAAQAAYVDTGAFPELLSIYHLFGDPALRIAR